MEPFPKIVSTVKYPELSLPKSVTCTISPN
nr:MAG TPA: hypothetical protein [Caudoviricetes sp.]